MADMEDAPIDDILKSIREAIIDKEQRRLEQRQVVHIAVKAEEPQDEVFELSKNMMVKREDIPYQLGVWSFDDVAKKMMKKYKIFFAGRKKQSVESHNDNLRVSVKAGSQA
jgi:hypothetical protein